MSEFDKLAEDTMEEMLKNMLEAPVQYEEIPNRIKIATAAMQGLIAKGYYDTASAESVAQDAVKLADALIEELKKK